MTAKSSDRLLEQRSAVAAQSPLSRGLPPTMAEKLHMKKTARGNRFSLDFVPAPPGGRFSLTDAHDGDLIDGGHAHAPTTAVETQPLC